MTSTLDWTFSIFSPNHQCEVDAGANEQKQQQQLFQLKSSKPATAAAAAKTSTQFSTTAAVGSQQRDEEQQQQQQQQPANNSSETIGLLQAEGSSSSAHTMTTSTLNPTGWTFASPFWTLQSHFLLRIVYQPAWQSIPAFTRRHHRCCSRGCCSCPTSPKFLSVTFTTDDIESIQRTTISIPGIKCTQEGLQVQLRPSPDFQVSVPVNIPSQYQQEWNEQVQHARHNQSDQSFLNQQLQYYKTKKPVMRSKGPTLFFVIPSNVENGDPPLLWKVHLPPPEGGPIAVESLTVLDGPLVSSQEPPPSHVFINGYQSWSFAGSIPKGQPQPQSAMPNVFSRAFNFGGRPPPVSTELYEEGRRHVSLGPMPPQSYLSDFFTCITSYKSQFDTTTTTTRPMNDVVNNDNNDDVAPMVTATKLENRLDEAGGPALVLGWLSQHYQLGVLCMDPQLERIQMHASNHGQLLLPGGDNGTSFMETDWAYCQLESPVSYDEEPLVYYLRAVAAYNQAKPLQNGSLLTGWCSWYHYYENITEQNLRSNFAKLAALRQTVPTNVVVVDDGYMTAWGDWDSVKPKKFHPTQKMKVIAQDILSQNLRPGIWLAPFTCDKHSQLYKDHPDWIIRSSNGSPANSANCGKFFYGLDATNPNVLQYVYQCIHRAVHEWGFTVLKIDFLYACCLHGNGKYDLSLSRAQAMHLALQTIRSAAGPNVFLIGCGCPIGSGVGYVDGMRVSADTGPTWYPAFPLPSWDHSTLPSVRGMLRNSINRAPMGHRWWHNDPDCLMLGSTTSLTQDEVISCASIVALTCGMLLLSDDLSKVQPARMKVLTKIFPMTGISAIVLDMHANHTATGLPRLLRLWCTDEHNLRRDFLGQWRSHSRPAQGDDHRSNNTRRSVSVGKEEDNVVLETHEEDYNAEATLFGRIASFRANNNRLASPNERRRNCIHVVKGLGTWTVLSMSNWLDKKAIVEIPVQAALDYFPDMTTRSIIGTSYGYHVFSFWACKYSWIAEPTNTEEKGALISRLMRPHETEIFHIKAVTPDVPQYIGSDLHFSCGFEVLDFQVTTSSSVQLQLRTEFQRSGHVLLFIPISSTNHVKATCNGKPALWSVVGSTPGTNGDGSPKTAVLGRILQVAVVVEATNNDAAASPSLLNGQVILEY